MELNFLPFKKEAISLILSLFDAYSASISNDFIHNNEFCILVSASRSAGPHNKLRQINFQIKRFSGHVLNNSNLGKRLKIIIKELNLNPEYVFENLNLESTKKEILNISKGLSGIYMILNKVNQNYYVGSASTNKFYARFSNHLIYFRGSKILKLAVKKYGLENFSFIILELFPNIVTKENNKELIDLEDKYLKILLPDYNILTEAGSSFGYKHTEIDRLKMKEVYTEARRDIIGNLNKDKKLSYQTVDKLRIIALNRSPMKKENK